MVVMIIMMIITIISLLILLTSQWHGANVWSWPITQFAEEKTAKRKTKVTLVGRLLIVLQLLSCLCDETECSLFETGKVPVLKTKQNKNTKRNSKQKQKTNKNKKRKKRKEKKKAD